MSTQQPATCDTRSYSSVVCGRSSEAELEAETKSDVGVAQVLSERWTRLALLRAPEPLHTSFQVRLGDIHAGFNENATSRYPRTSRGGVGDSVTILSTYSLQDVWECIPHAIHLQCNHNLLR